MIYAALDLSSHSGWACWCSDTGRLRYGTKHLVGWEYDAASRLEFWRVWLNDWFKIHDPELIGIEGWILAAHNDAVTLGRQIALNEFTHWVIKRRGARSTSIAAGTWRKTWYGSAHRPANCDWKHMAIDRVKAMGFAPPDDNPSWLLSDHNTAEAIAILDNLIHAKGKHIPPWRDHAIFSRKALPL
jgi:hypothetical protein